MEKRIQLEVGDVKPSEVTELILDNCRAATIEGLTDEYTNLESLSMINLGLTTLKGLPALPNLLQLEASDNRITDDLDAIVKCPNVRSLKICNNRIESFDAIKPLKELKELSSLDLMECPITEKENYRNEVFTIIPHLIFLDGIDREGNMEPDSDSDYDVGDEEEEDISGLEEDEEDEGNITDEEEVEDGGEDGAEEGQEEEEENVDVNGERNGVESKKDEEDEAPPAKKIKLVDEADVVDAAAAVPVDAATPTDTVTTDNTCVSNANS